MTKKKKPTRKTLPQNLDERLEEAAKSNDYEAVHEMLEGCLPDAHVRGIGETLLMNRHCTVDLARWSIERGTDIVVRISMLPIPMETQRSGTVLAMAANSP